MVALRKDVEEMVPLSKYQALLNDHLRIVKEKDQKIHLLEKQLRFRKELDAVPAEIMSQPQKAALNAAVKVIETTKPGPDGRILLNNTDDLAKSVGISQKRFQKHLTYCDEIGVIQKETLPVRDDNGKILYTETYVTPTNRTPYPRMYEAEQARNHGGDRLTCRCGSERIKKEVRYICMDCGEVHTKPPKFEPPVEPVEPEDQFGSTVNSEQETENTDPEATIVGSYLVPEDQLGLTVESDQRTNLTRSSNNYPEDQLDPTVEAEDESNKHHNIVSSAIDADTIIRDWLNKRRGSDHIIYATGKLTPIGKYLPLEKEPDLDAYIAGNIADIYGSRLFNPETGLTNVLCFEIDKPEQDEQAQNYLLDLARAGAAPIYWMRYARPDGNRGHLELYFDRPVDPEAAKAWAIEICPDLADIPEVFPCQKPVDNRKRGLSWPLYQRISNQVYPCQAKFMLPSPHAGGLQEVDPTDKESLAEVITVAVTPAALVEEFAVVLAEREALQKQEQEKENAVCGFIGQKPKLLTNVSYDRDLVPQVMADFYAQCSWDDLATMAGGWHNGFFKAVWRGERTASVKPDADGRYACDYGNHGSFPKKLDKYEAYCLICNIDKKTDLAERCAELRRANISV